MNFNTHSHLEGKHAFLSASKYSWLRYSDAKLAETFANHVAAAKGTALHEYACMAIRLKQKQASVKKTMNMYVNDALKYGMDPEVLLYYSKYCYGTADAIGFEDGLLRIHDLKTGTKPACMDQLKIYAAIFCLEYDVTPGDIDFELRIYQNDDVVKERPTTDGIAHVVDRIVTADRILNEISDEEPTWVTRYI